MATYMHTMLYSSKLHQLRTMYLHCKNKSVVLTTEWLPWLQPRGRDSGYVVYSFANYIIQPQRKLLRLSYNQDLAVSNP